MSAKEKLLTAADAPADSPQTAPLFPALLALEMARQMVLAGTFLLARTNARGRKKRHRQTGAGAFLIDDPLGFREECFAPDELDGFDPPPPATIAERLSPERLEAYLPMIYGMLQDFAAQGNTEFIELVVNSGKVRRGIVTLYCLLGDQKRKNRPQESIADHSMRVTAEAIELLGQDTTAALKALLHDVLEDMDGVDRRDIFAFLANAFGKKVAQGVERLSLPDKQMMVDEAQQRNIDYTLHKQHVKFQRAELLEPDETVIKAVDSLDAIRTDIADVKAGQVFFDTDQGLCIQPANTQAGGGKPLVFSKMLEGCDFRFVLNMVYCGALRALGKVQIEPHLTRNYPRIARRISKRFSNAVDGLTLLLRNIERDCTPKPTRAPAGGLQRAGAEGPG